MLFTVKFQFKWFLSYPIISHFQKKHLFVSSFTYHYHNLATLYCRNIHLACLVMVILLIYSDHVIDTMARWNMDVKENKLIQHSVVHELLVVG